MTTSIWCIDIPYGVVTIQIMVKMVKWLHPYDVLTFHMVWWQFQLWWNPVKAVRLGDDWRAQLDQNIYLGGWNFDKIHIIVIKIQMMQWHVPPGTIVHNIWSHAFIYLFVVFSYYFYCIVNCFRSMFKTAKLNESQSWKLKM